MAVPLEVLEEFFANLVSGHDRGERKVYHARRDCYRTASGSERVIASTLTEKALRVICAGSLLVPLAIARGSVTSAAAPRLIESQAQRKLRIKLSLLNDSRSYIRQAFLNLISV